MKKGKKLSALFLTLALLAMPIPVLADIGDPEPLLDGARIYYLDSAKATSKSMYSQSPHHFPGDGRIDPGQVTISDPSIIRLLGIRNEAISYYNYSDDAYGLNQSVQEISLQPIKAGTTFLTVTLPDGNTVSKELTVLKYTNPVKTFKITGINSGKNLASKFKKQNLVQGKSLTKSVSGGKLTVKAAAGWMITNISVGHDFDGEGKYSSINVAYPIQQNKDTVPFFQKLYKNHRYSFQVTLMNLETRGEINLTYSLS